MPDFPEKNQTYGGTLFWLTLYRHIGCFFSSRWLKNIDSHSLTIPENGRIDRHKLYNRSTQIVETVIVIYCRLGLHG